MAEMEMLQWADPWLASEKPEAPVILQGPTGAQWAKVEQELAKFAVCAQAGCGECADCKKVAQDVHPDVVRFDDSEKTLKVRHVRVAREQWAAKPFGKRRLIIIPQAERLTPEAANTLLKELEEPTVYNRFVLWTAWPGRLLATIRSRSQSRRLPKQYAAETAISGLEWGTVVSWKRKEAFSDDELQLIYARLQQLAAERGVDADWYRASLRLRDFYRIASTQGNVKMATDVLLASLHELR